MSTDQSTPPDAILRRNLVSMWHEVAVRTMGDCGDEHAVATTMLEAALSAMLMVDGPRALAVRLRAGCERCEALAEEMGDGITRPKH